MSLPSPNASFNRSSHLAVVVAVVLFPLTHFLDDLGVDPGPEVVCDRVLVLHLIIAQDAQLVKFADCANDLLKGAINDGPCITAHVSKTSALVSCSSMSSGEVSISADSSCSVYATRSAHNTFMLERWQMTLGVSLGREFANCARNGTGNWLSCPWKPALAACFCPTWRTGNTNRNWGR